MVIKSTEFDERNDKSSALLHRYSTLSFGIALAI
jgi:hypothetical protein